MIILSLILKVLKLIIEKYIPGEDSFTDIEIYFCEGSRPGRVRLVDEEPWHSEGVRMKAVKNYLMYFWIDEEKKLVQVFAVIYARRDQVSALSNMEM